jgi:hypothetical protein
MNSNRVEALKRVYVWGYPYEFAARLRRNLTTDNDGGVAEHSAAAPLNTLGHQRKLSVPSYRVGVAPNVDTLYSLAWLDLEAGPFALELPDFGDRYYTVQVGFADTSSFAFGQRTHGAALPRIELHRGPRQMWEEHEGRLLVATCDRYAMVAGRVLVDADDPEDVRAVHGLQDAMRLLAPATAGTAATSIGPASPTPESEGSEGVAFFRRLAAVLNDIDPASIPADVHVDLTSSGLVGDGSRLHREECARAFDEGQRLVERSVSGMGTQVNGWSINYDGTDFGDDRLRRAAVARAQIYVNPAQEALYPVVESDSEGEPLSGGNEYEIRFSPGQTPPARFFWSLTMYHKKGFLVDNARDRFAIGDRSPGLTHEVDGTLVVKLSQREPASRRSNWLPAPEGEFRLMLRLYGPSVEASTGVWSPPPVTRTSG